MSHGNSADVPPADGSPVDGDPTEAKRLPSRFAYATGARPLEGYTIKRGVGVGGFGEVYYATSDAGKDVALKRIQRNLDIELRGVRQCLNLKHPHLLALYDIKHDTEGQSWVVMEYIAGANLQDVIERNPRGMTRDDVHRWFDGMAAGVEHLHDCGIVHRDLKPGNIFLDHGGSNGGTVKIGDYGLSKFISCSRRSGQTQSVGTFHYMAPEIGQGRYGKEIDIYALGIMLYEMLTGRVPYEGESSQEIIMKHLTARPDLATVPPPYRAIIERALAKEPSARFASVAEMRTAVANAMSPGKAQPSAGPMPFSSGSATRGVERNYPTPPVFHTVADGMREFDRRLTTTQAGPALKTIILIIGVVVIFTHMRFLLPFLLFIAVIYTLYVFARAFILAPPASAVPTPNVDQMAQGIMGATEPVNAVLVADSVLPIDRRAATAPRGKKQVVNKALIDEQLRQAWRRRPVTRHGMDLTGALIMSSCVAAVIGIMTLLIPGFADGDGLRGSVSNWLPVYTWTTLSSVAGAWAVLTLSKIWEGSTGDAVQRRFVQLVAGLLIGGFSWGLGQFLLVRPTYLIHPNPAALASLPTALHGVDGLPALPGYFAYFGTLFLLVRWWKQADPLRRVRLSVWGTGLVAVTAIALEGLCPFPRGFLIAATTAVSVQLAAPWITPGDRKTLVAQSREMHA